MGKFLACLYQISGSLNISFPGLFFVFLAGSHIGPGCSMDDKFGLKSFQIRKNTFKVSYLKLCVGWEEGTGENPFKTTS